MRAPLKNVLDLIHMSDVTGAAVKSSRWHGDILRALRSIKEEEEEEEGHVFAATVLTCAAAAVNHVHTQSNLERKEVNN